MVLWDTESHPDFQGFLDVVERCGNKLVVFATREFSNEDVEELSAHLEDCDLTREERRGYESRLRDMRIFEGVVCSLELAFDYNSRLYVYEVQPDWYEEFLTIEDEIMSRLADEDDTEDDGSLGGY